MAIWQFKFYMVPEDTVRLLHGSSVVSLASYQSTFPPQVLDESDNQQNYWESRDPRSYEATVQTLMHPRPSWSKDALMFGEKEGYSIALWVNDIEVRLDVRSFDEKLVRSIIKFAASEDLICVMHGTGRVIQPIYEKVAREIANSNAAKIVSNPTLWLPLIARKFDDDFS